MKEFISYNALGIFSLIILALLLYHTRQNRNSDNALHQRIWFYSLLALFFTQLFDIISYGVDGQPFPPAVSYLSNILLFTSLATFTSVISLFFEYSISFSTKHIQLYKKIFSVLVAAIFTLLLCSVPFSLVFTVDSGNVYHRGPFYYINILITYFPLVFILFRTIFLHKNSNLQIKSILITGSVGTLFFSFMQLTLIAPVPMILPSITIVMLFLYLSLTNNSIYNDFLTGLKNRKGMEHFFSGLRVQNVYLAVVFFDINKFKEINDRFGHREGDITLKAFGRILGSVTRRDDLVARVGGDEFLLVAALNNESEIQFILKRLDQEIDTYNSTLQRPYKLSVSHGISINPPGAPLDKDFMLQDADQKMYQNKLEFESPPKNSFSKKVSS